VCSRAWRPLDVAEMANKKINPFHLLFFPLRLNKSIYFSKLRIAGRFRKIYVFKTDYFSKTPKNLLFRAMAYRAIRPRNGAGRGERR
jgi:hypothetical protein